MGTWKSAPLDKRSLHLNYKEVFKMKFKKILSTILVTIMTLLFVSGCGADTSNSEASSSKAILPETEFLAEEMFTKRDKETSYVNYEKIELQDGNSKSKSANVSIEGDTIKIESAGVYALSGKLSNGQIIVDTDKEDEVQLVLQGVKINCDTSAAIYVKQAGKVLLTLDEGSENKLSNKKDFVAIDENNIDSVIFSKDDLTLNGKGSLVISAEYGHGIVSKDNLLLTSGEYDISAKGHGIEGKDSVRIADGKFTIKSGKDGIHAENVDDDELGFIYISGGDFEIESETDGLDASAGIQIDAGNFVINSGGTSENASTDKKGEKRPQWGDWESENSIKDESKSVSAKGVKADGDIYIKEGKLTIDSSDDSLHSNSSLYTKEGNIEISSGDDGIHADAKVAINGGNILISKSYEGIEGQSIDITGGEISVTSSDDGFNATGEKGDSDSADADSYINIKGGKLNINAEGDGIDSNGDIYVSGGESYVIGSTRNDDAALDYSGNAEISGGIFLAVGSSGMAQNFGDSSSQGSILLNSSGTVKEGSEIILKDEGENEILSYTPEKKYSSVLASSPEIMDGSTYTLIMGDESESITMDGLIYGSGFSMGGNPGGQAGPPEKKKGGQPPEHGSEQKVEL